MFWLTETRKIYAIRRAYDLLAKKVVLRSRLNLPPQPRMAVIPTDYMGISIIGNGIYERREIEALKHLFRARDLTATVCLDIGGNIGNHSIALAGVFAEIVAFEPNKSIASLFRTNLVLSQTANVRLYEVGLGQDDQDLKFAIREPGNDGSGTFAGGVGDITLPVRRGDDYLRAHEPEIATGKKRIGFVKCDVEGFEDQVFAGLRQTLSTHQPLVFFESNDRFSGDKAWKELQAAGYHHLTRLRETGDHRSKMMQELERLARGYACWFEPIETIPDRRCNLIASIGPVDG